MIEAPIYLFHFEGLDAFEYLEKYGYPKMTYAEWLEKAKTDAAAEGKDLAIALLQTQDGLTVEADVIKLDPGAHPTRFPGPQTQAQKDAGQSWSEAWIIHRCAPQPAAERISIPAGKFLPGGMPDIQFDD